jgi:hypothetical protein
MKKWKVFYSPDAQIHIVETVEYYDNARKGIGTKFYKAIKKATSNLRISPIYPIRYDNIRCFPIPNFPYMLHFEINEQNNTVYIYAVICTYRNPDDAWVK